MLNFGNTRECWISGVVESVEFREYYRLLNFESTRECWISEVLESVEFGEFGSVSIVVCSKNVELNCSLFEGCLECSSTSANSEKGRLSS